MDDKSTCCFSLHSDSVLRSVCVCMCVHACVTFGRAGRVTGELALTAAHRSWTPALPCSKVTPLTHTHTQTLASLTKETYIWVTGPISLPFLPLLIYGHWSPLGQIYMHSSCSCAPYFLLLFLPHTYPPVAVVWFTIQCSDTCFCCVSTSGEKEVRECAEKLKARVILN